MARVYFEQIYLIHIEEMGNVHKQRKECLVAMGHKQKNADCSLNVLF